MALAVAFTPALASGAGPAPYFVTDLGPIGASGGVPSINNNGQVIIGVSIPTGGSQPYLYQNGVFTNLSPALGGGSYNYVGAINNRGDMIGTSGIEPTGFILYHDGFEASFSGLGGGPLYPTAINDSDAVALEGQSVTFVPTAIRWVDANGDRIPQASEYQNLPPRPSDMSAGVAAINNSGVAVGESYTSIGAGSHAVRWVGNAVQDLQVSQTSQSAATAINNAGTIVGDIGDAGTLYKPFLWDPNAGLTLIPANGIAESVNNLGQVVGGFNNGDAPGWLWSQAVGYQPLQGLIQSGSGWTLDQAQSINDDGQIVGIGYLNGVREGYLLTPVPEPASLGALALCTGMLLRLPRRRCDQACSLPRR